MRGFDTSAGYRIAPMDSDEARINDEERQENHGKDYEVNPILSCSNTDFGGKDPATIEELSGTPAELATFDPRTGERLV
jgi:hypothetical protein